MVGENDSNGNLTKPLSPTAMKRSNLKASLPIVAMHVAKGVADLLTHLTLIQLNVSASLPFQESSTGIVLKGLDDSCDQLLALTLLACGGHVLGQMKTDRNTEATVANMIEGLACTAAYDVVRSKFDVAGSVIGRLLHLFLHEACFAEVCRTQARKRKRSS